MYLFSKTPFPKTPLYPFWVRYLLLICVLYSFLAILEVNFGIFFELSNCYQLFVNIMPSRKFVKDVNFTRCKFFTYKKIFHTVITLIDYCLTNKSLVLVVRSYKRNPCTNSYSWKCKVRFCDSFHVRDHFILVIILCHISDVVEAE